MRSLYFIDPNPVQTHSASHTVFRWDQTSEDITDVGPQCELHTFLWGDFEDQGYTNLLIAFLI